MYTGSGSGTGAVPNSVPYGILRAGRPTGPLAGFAVLLLCFLAGQVASGVALVVFLLVSGTGIPMGVLSLDPVEQLVLTGGFLVSTMVLALWVVAKERRSFGSLGFTATRRVWRPLVLGAGLAVVAVTVPVLVGLVSGQFVPGTAPPVTVVSVAVLLTLLGGFVVQATTEEVLVRGYLVQVTWRKWGLYAAVVVQTVVFTLMHGFNTGFGLVPLVNLVLISLVLVFWALAEGNLWGVCAFHAVWNWCQGNVYGAEVSGLDLSATLLDIRQAPEGSALFTGGDFGLEGSLLTTLMLLVLLIGAFGVFRRRGNGTVVHPRPVSDAPTG